MKTPFDVQINLIPKEHLFKHFLLCLDYTNFNYDRDLSLINWKQGNRECKYINDLLLTISLNCGELEAKKANEILLVRLKKNRI